MYKVWSPDQKAQQSMHLAQAKLVALCTGLGLQTQDIYSFKTVSKTAEI